MIGTHKIVRDNDRPHASIKQRNHGLLSVPAAIIGNALEWFDVLVYATFVTYIAANFFPNADPAISMMIALGTFGASFVARPLGAIVIGWIADRGGRRTALALVSILMFAGTAIIAFLPPYSSLGITAPVLLVIARLIQGFAAGGEFGSATAYLAEQSREHRGFYASWQFAGHGLGVLFAALFGAFLTSELSEAEMVEWGWRIPFFFGMLVGPVAYIIRFHANESPEFETTRAAGELDEATAFDKNFWARVATGIGLVIVATAAVYLVIYMPTLAEGSFGIQRGISRWTSVCAGLTLCIATPIAGWIGDRYGRIRLAVACAIGLLVAPPLLFNVLNSAPAAGPLLFTQFLLSLLVAGYFGALAAMLSDLFRVAQRSLGMAICYNLAVMLAGAFAPLVYAALGKYVGHVAPSYYVSGAAIISLVALGVVAHRRWLLLA